MGKWISECSIKLWKRNTGSERMSCNSREKFSKNKHEWSVCWMTSFHNLWNLRRITHNIQKDLCEFIILFFVLFYFSSILQFTDCISISQNVYQFIVKHLLLIQWNFSTLWIKYRHQCIDLSFCEVFKYQCSKSILTVVAPICLEENFRFLPTIFNILLIIQFNKVLISLSPYKLVALCYGAQCHSESPVTRSYPEKREGDKY